MDITHVDRMRMLSIGEYQVPEAIFSSPDALEIYLSDVRARREEHRHTRRLRLFLEMARDRVQEELNTNYTAEDEEILEELRAVLNELEQRLCKLSTTQRSPFHAASSPLLLDLAPMEQGVAVFAAHTDQNREAVEAEIAREEKPAVCLFDRTVPDCSDAELETRAQTLLIAIETLRERWSSLNASGLLLNGERLDRVACFATRALTCQLGSLFAQARDQAVLSRVARTIVEIRDSMELARGYANDYGDCFPFDEDCWDDPDRYLQSEDWDLLTDRYEQIAEAQQAWDWYISNREFLAHGTQHALLNTIVAQQQRLYRTLEYYEGRDRLQAEFYGNLREAANLTGYLTALCPDTSDTELNSCSARMCDLWRQAEQEVSTNRERAARDAQKGEAIQAVLTWSEQRKGHLVNKFTRDQDRGELIRLLEDCNQAGVPPTNISIRTALLEIAPFLLENAPNCVKFLDAVLAERKRKGIDKAVLESAVDEAEEEPSDTLIAQFQQYASLFTANQKILILGGTPRQNVCEELQSKLGCAEVKWPESKRGDRVSKFQAEIKRADILLLVKNFASHEMTDKGRDLIRAKNGHFVLLPGGYGVKQIIHQLYQYAIRTENTRFDSAAFEVPTGEHSSRSVL